MLLVASEVPGVERYFTPWVHFVPFKTAQDAVTSIVYFRNNEAERRKIANAGRERAEDLIRSRSFWILIDSGLQDKSFY